MTDRAALQGEGRGRSGETKASFFAGGQELQGLLEVLDGRVDVLVLQRAARILTILLGFGEVLRGQSDATWWRRRRVRM